MFQTKDVEKLETHFMFKNFFPKIVPFYEIKWKNIKEWEKPQMTIWRKRVACWIPRATNTHTGCVILIAFPLKHGLHERASMSRFTYSACLVKTS